MASSTPNTIILKSISEPLFKESEAAGAINPGHFIKRDTSGNYVVQDTAGIEGPLLVAVENDLTAKEISDAYASGDTVRSIYAQPGYEIYAFVPAAAPAIVIGDELELDATGSLVKRTTGIRVATALDAVDNSGGGTPARIKVEII